MLVGDAAHQVNPISGGGINSALVAGNIAGKIAAQAILDGDVSDKRLQAYPDQWHKRVGKSHERFYRIKQAVYKLTDDDLNHTANAILRLPPGRRTIAGVFKSALFRHPSLFIDIVKAFM
jgi:digeranylgeranylglycerophospholipid reductase